MFPVHAELLPIFETIPMKFGDEEQEISPFLGRLLQRAGLAVPLDQPGTNLSQLAQSHSYSLKKGIWMIWIHETTI